GEVASGTAKVLEDLADSGTIDLCALAKNTVKQRSDFWSFEPHLESQMSPVGSICLSITTTNMRRNWINFCSRHGYKHFASIEPKPWRVVAANESAAISAV